MITLMLKKGQPDKKPFTVRIGKSYYIDFETTWYDEQEFWAINYSRLAASFCNLYFNSFYDFDYGEFCSAFENYVNKEYKKINNHNDFKEIVL